VSTASPVSSNAQGRSRRALLREVRSMAANHATSPAICGITQGCTSQPTRDAFKSLLHNLKRVRSARGRYPTTVRPISIQGVAYSSESRSATLRRSDRAPGVRLMYHPFSNTYALELWFPGLQPDFKPSTEHYDSAPATAFVACTAIHFGQATDIRNAGGYVIPSVRNQPPILFTPRLGIYTYAS
jgi:hypothetical protein